MTINKLIDEVEEKLESEKETRVKSLIRSYLSSLESIEQRQKNLDKERKCQEEKLAKLKSMSVDEVMDFIYSENNTVNIFTGGYPAYTVTSTGFGTCTGSI